MIKSKKGITLVALIITIIVLLLLAVTTIQLIQTNDIINYGEEAVVTYDKEEIEEKIRLAILPALIEGKGKIKGDKAFKILNNGLKEIGYLGDYIEELPVLVIIGNNEYIIEEDGTIKKATDIYKLKILETTISGEKLSKKSSSSFVCHFPRSHIPSRIKSFKYDLFALFLRYNSFDFSKEATSDSNISDEEQTSLPVLI